MWTESNFLLLSTWEASELLPAHPVYKLPNIFTSTHYHDCALQVVACTVLSQQLRRWNGIGARFRLQQNRVVDGGICWPKTVKVNCKMRNMKTTQDTHTIVGRGRHLVGWRITVRGIAATGRAVWVAGRTMRRRSRCRPQATGRQLRQLRESTLMGLGHAQRRGVDKDRATLVAKTGAKKGQHWDDQGVTSLPKTKIIKDPGFTS